MKKILNIVLGDMSTGELAIALSFVQGQTTHKYSFCFLIPEEKLGIIDMNSVAIYTLSKNNTPIENQVHISNIIDEISPDLIILFDAFTFEYAQNWTGFNFELLKKKNIKIASIDEYEYAKTNYKIDYYGIFVKRLPDLLSHCDFVLKNCPLSMPVREKSHNAYYYKALNNLYLMNESEQMSVRKEMLGAEIQDTKVVFFATSAWEVEGAYSFACQNELAKWLGPIVFNYLSDLKEKIILFHVGKENWSIASNEYVTYVHRDDLFTKDFEKCIQMSNLFLTYNIVSISLSKAVIFNVPSIVLNNRKIIEFGKLANVLKERPSWYQEMANNVKKVYPFSASLFGWSNFLKNCLAENEYAKTFETANVFNYNASKMLLEKALCDEQYRKTLMQKQKKFLQRYEYVQPVESVLDEIFAYISY